MTTRVLPPKWTLQPFELELAVAEAESIVKAPVERDEAGLFIEQELHHSSIARLARRMAFASGVEGSKGIIQTTQNALEISAGGACRKVLLMLYTGVHPKGKCLSSTG